MSRRGKRVFWLADVVIKLRYDVVNAGPSYVAVNRAHHAGTVSQAVIFCNPILLDLKYQYTKQAVSPLTQIQG